MVLREIDDAGDDEYLGTCVSAGRWMSRRGVTTGFDCMHNDMLERRLCRASIPSIQEVKIEEIR